MSGETSNLNMDQSIRYYCKLHATPNTTWNMNLIYSLQNIDSENIGTQTTTTFPNKILIT